MTPEQLADILVGIARAQANIVSGIEKVLDKSLTHEVRQAIQRLNHATLTSGQEKNPITLKNLPTTLLQSALFPNSVAGREIEKTALKEAQKLLR